MKINETRRVGAINPYQANGGPRTESSGRKRQTDNVQFSSEAMEMLAQTRLNGPERTQKLEELKQSVATGSYRIDAGKLAEKLLPFFK